MLRQLTPHLRLPLCALAVAGALLLPAGCRDARPARVVTQSADAYFPVRLGARTVRLQLALSPAEMQMGLMGRHTLGADDGMVFIYPKPTRLAFWMRNTPLPLDIGYFNAAGELREIHAMQPFDDRTVPANQADLQIAIEMNQGWYARNGVKPGAQLDLAALREAIRARGFKPADLGLESGSRYGK